MGSGDLIDVTNVKVDEKSNKKVKHSLRGATGVVKGVVETTVTFDADVSEEGAEADWGALVRGDTIKQLRVKVPGETITVTGGFDTRSLELPMDDAIKVSLTFVGITTA
jgi:hypothetical protein